MLDAYVVVDLEMTGVHPKVDAIMEIGAVKVQGERVETFQTLVNPNREIPERVTEITAITEEMVKSAPTVEEALKHFLEFSGDLPIVGHMVQMDYSFLKQAAVNLGMKYQRDGLDTLFLSRKLLPELEKYTLSYLTEYYDIDLEGHHRALADAMATNILYRSLCTEFEEKNPKDFKARPLIFKAKKQTAITVQQLRYLKEFTKYHGIEMPEGVENMTRSEASRLTDQLITKYGAMIRNSHQE
jgi:DNA polymerase-3 subunit alpha (Gram-positive type)